MLRDERSRAALLAELEDVDRLVLLGDVVELRQGPIRDALAAAEPALAALGSALDASSRVEIVPGNHDHHLLGPWFERRRRDAESPPLGLDEPVAWETEEPLGAIARALAPAQVRVSYPGVWLRPDVYATHGHYLDRHTTVPMFERLGAGAMARIVGAAGDPSHGVDAYEAVLAPMYAWIHELAQHGGPALGASSHGASSRAWEMLEGSRGARRRRRLRRRLLIAAYSLLIAALSRSPVGPLRADISGPELRRAALRAFDEVLVHLRVRAEHVIFGHTHRAGPLPRDEEREWVATGGARLVNAGSWVHEPAYLGRRPAESPYRAGFYVALGDEGAPELRNALD